MTTRSPVDHAKAQSQRPWFRVVARLGMAARGAVFLVIGILAVKVATDSGGATTDQKGALKAVAHQRFGEVLLLMLAFGLASYALWRLSQAFLDTDDKGDDGNAWAVRASKLGSGVVYGVLCATAIKILAGSGGGGSGSDAPKRATGGVLGWPGGRVLVVLAALVVLAVAGWNLYRGLSRTFMKRLHPPTRVRPTVEWVGVVGMSARAVAFGLIAFFLMKAAVEYDPSEAVGLDGALSRLAGEPQGKTLLGLVAVGLVAFALYCFAEARYREV